MKLILILLMLFPIAVHAKTIVKHAYPTEHKTAFLQSCIGAHKEMVEPCKCMLVGFQNAMPFEGFSELSQSPNIAQDPRFLAISKRCTGPRRR